MLPKCTIWFISLGMQSFDLPLSKLLINIYIDLITEVRYSQMSLRHNKGTLFADSQAFWVVTPNWLNPFSRNTSQAKWWYLLTNHSAAWRCRLWNFCRAFSSLYFILAIPHDIYICCYVSYSCYASHFSPGILRKMLLASCKHVSRDHDTTLELLTLHSL